MKSSVVVSCLVLIFALLLWPVNLFLKGGLGILATSVPESIFAEDYQGRQLILRNTYLYPTVFLARVFQNKLNIPLSKFEGNFFSLLDPNYYFFSSHPREMYHNSNLVKFPFILIIFFFYGLFSITGLKHFRLLGLLFLVSVSLLSLLVDFGRYDLILWPMFSVVIIHGYREFSQRYSFSAKIVLFLDRKSTRLNSSHLKLSRMPSSA